MVSLANTRTDFVFCNVRLLCVGKTPFMLNADHCGTAYGHTADLGGTTRRVGGFVSVHSGPDDDDARPPPRKKLLLLWAMWASRC